MSGCDQLVTWVNSVLERDCNNADNPSDFDWTGCWRSGQMYIDIVSHFRPDLTHGRTFSDSGHEACLAIFDVINEKLNLAILVDPEDIRVLDNVAFIGQLKLYFESPEFVIDKDLSSGNPGSPLTHPLPRSTSSNNNLADIKRPLCSRLFERKSVNERFDELAKFDGIELNECKMDGENKNEQTKENPFDENDEEPNVDEVKSVDNAKESENPFESDDEDEKDVQLKITESAESVASQKSETKTADDDSGNPFDEVDLTNDENVANESGNPFGDDDDVEEEKEDNREENKADANSTNPFGSDSDGADDQAAPGNPFGDFDEDCDVKLKTPPKRPPPPKIQPVKPMRKKSKAPPPPRGQAPPTPSATSTSDTSASRPRRPPPPKPKEAQAPGFGHPLVKRQVSNKEDELKLEMVELEQKLQDLEVNAAKLEDMLRFSAESGEKDDALMGEWLDIVRERNELARRDIELGFKLRLNRLEVKHAELEFEMRKILHKPPTEQSDADKQRESAIMAELVVLVNKRDEIVASIEMERERANSRESTPAAPAVTSTPEPVKVKKKRGVSMKKIKSFVRSKKDK